MNNNSKISGLRTLSALTAIILVLPIPFLKTMTGFYLWLSPFIMLNSIITLRSFVWLNLAASLILIPVIIHKRWFCQNLCPAGWCFDLTSDLNKCKIYTYYGVPEIGKWIAIISLTASVAGIPLLIFLDPLVIFHGFFSVFAGKIKIIEFIFLSGFLILLIINFFLPGIWCKKLCPLGGLQVAISEIKSYVKRISGSTNKSDNHSYDTGRRYFIMSGIGLITGFSVKRLWKPEVENVIRPPASAATALFNSLCCRCGNCIKACPTEILIYHTVSAGILSFMTPEISFNPGYCLEECNICSKVCPTGAITLFDPGAKDKLFMGRAEIVLENCRLVNNIECNRCRESCKYQAIEFHTATGLLNMAPVVDSKKCVGCGACMVICPEECITIKPV